MATFIHTTDWCLREPDNEHGPKIPQVVTSAKWYDLVAAAHLDSARPEAAPAEPSPLDRVQAKAQAILGDRFDDCEPLTHDALQGVPQGSELTFAFEVPGVEFNPARVSFGWFEDEHTVHVRLRASAALERTTARSRMTVFLGAIILADVPFSLHVDAPRNLFRHLTKSWAIMKSPRAACPLAAPLSWLRSTARIT